MWYLCWSLLDHKKQFLSYKIKASHLINPTNEMNETTVLNKTVTKRRIIKQSRPIVCNDCGNHWIHVDGSGFRSAILFCDLCANRKSPFQDRRTKFGGLIQKNLKQCDCGSSFVLKATIWCPQCKSTDLEISSSFASLD